MAPRDLYNHLSPVQSIAPGAKTATVNGTGVDLRDHASAIVLFDIGAWTDGTHTPKIQESDDNVTYTDVAAENLQGAFTAISGEGHANAVQKVGYIGNKRYIRAHTTVAGATTGAVYGASVVRGLPRFQGTVN
ncbi:hypothetical protein [Ensifer aridi]|uniref:hypothetical protein n=1 Tax=Ensifer aridi TaxID=1708715 RepID=UPI000A109762|nr:hypothetical protein [Ensifer aridi]